MTDLTIEISTFRWPAICLTGFLHLYFLNIFTYIYIYKNIEFPASNGLLAGGLAASFILQALACVQLAGTAGIQQGTQWTIRFSLAAGTGMTHLFPTFAVLSALVLLSVNTLHAVLEREVLLYWIWKKIRRRQKGYHWLFLLNPVLKWELRPLCMHLTG